MKTRTKLSLCALFAPYLIWTFVTLEPNVFNWYYAERAVLVLFGVLFYSRVLSYPGQFKDEV